MVSVFQETWNEGEAAMAELIILKKSAEMVFIMLIKPV